MREATLPVSVAANTPWNRARTGGCVVRYKLRYLCASVFIVAMLLISAAPAWAQGYSGLTYGPNGPYYGLMTIACGLPTLANTTNLLRIHCWRRCHTRSILSLPHPHP